MGKLKLVSEYRDDSGKGSAREARRDGKIPAVIYGHKEAVIGLTMSEVEFKRLLHNHGESAVVELLIKGKVKQECNAIIRDVQVHPATGKILHVDFQRVSLDEKVRVEIPVVLKGDPKGVKEAGGILEHGLRSLNITCIPASIPEAIEIDVTPLDIGKSIHIEDIVTNYPDIEFLEGRDSTLAIVVPPVVEVKEEVVEEAEEAPAEPELISKEKKEGEEQASEEE